MKRRGQSKYLAEERSCEFGLSVVFEMLNNEEVLIKLGGLCLSEDI
jgi:hypothetical protein